MLSSSLGAGKIGCWNSLFCLYCQALFCCSNKTSEWCFLTVLMNDKEEEMISEYFSFVFCPTHHHVPMGKAANNCSILKYGGQVLQGSLQWLVLQVAQLRELRVWNTMNQNNMASWSELLLHCCLQESCQSLNSLGSSHVKTLGILGGVWPLMVSFPEKTPNSPVFSPITPL